MLQVTYIYHSSFLAETDENVLLFDYYRGVLPPIEEKKHLYVFASHRHEDHFSEEIFRLARRKGETTFILSSDIGNSRVPPALRDSVVWMEPGQSVEQKNIRIQALASTDEGVAFLVFSDGSILYHAGDLNDWHWEGEPPSWNDKMKKDYRDQIDRLACFAPRVDCAFVVLDGRQGEAFRMGMDYFLERVQTEAVFPMHFWERYQVISKYKKQARGRFFTGKVMDLRFPGQTFDLKEGRENG